MQPRAARRVSGVETRAATRGDGEVIELDLGIIVDPSRDKGGGWRAALGSAHDEAELKALKAAAQQRIAAGQLDETGQAAAGMPHAL